MSRRSSTSFHIGLGLCLVVFTGHPLWGQTRAVTADTTTLRSFVQDFYRWYESLSPRAGTEPVYIMALRRRPTAFTDDLAKALKADWMAQRHVSNEIVGLDGDPVLNAQDPWESYTVSGLTIQHDTVMVSLVGNSGTEQSEGSAVIAALVRCGPHWCFADFLDGTATHGVLEALRQLARARAKHR